MVFGWKGVDRGHPAEAGCDSFSLCVDTYPQFVSRWKNTGLVALGSYKGRGGSIDESHLPATFISCGMECCQGVERLSGPEWR